MAKKDPFRFCIKFNEQDPHQVKVAELLNMQGRGMTQFLTSAVLHYIQCEMESVDKDTLQEVDLRTVRAVLEQVLDEKLSGIQQLPVPPKPKKAVESKNVTTMQPALSQADKAAIRSAMEGFKKQF